MAGAHRVERAPAVARIAVLQALEQPLEGSTESRFQFGNAPASSRPGSRPGPGATPEDTLAALGRLGGEVEILGAASVDQCLDLAEHFELDLILLDRCDPATATEFFASHAAVGAPVVAVISPIAPESAALDAFRQGAADCVRVGDDYAEVLPLVAMEQIQRWRQLSERDAARDKIEWLESLNEAIVTEIPVCLVVLDAARRVVEVNPEFQRSFGFSSEQARGAEICEVLPSGLIEDGELMGLVPSPGTAPSDEPRLARMVDAEGRDCVFDVRSQSLGRDGYLLMTLSNVTKTEFLSRRLGELERFNDYVVQSINSALMVVDLDGLITYTNPRAGQILGHPEADLKGEPVARFFSAAGGAPSLVSRALDEGVHSKGGEMLISLADGSAVPIGISCTPLQGEDGEIRGAVAIFQDLSEIKELQRQVLQQEKMASIGQLAAGIAHEINNPVGFIHANLAQMSEYLDDLGVYLDSVGELQRAASRGGGEGVEQAVNALKAVAEKIEIDYLRSDFGSALRESLEGSERIRHIVSDLRDFSHRGGIEKTLADVNQCVDSTANIVWTMMKHSVELKKEYADLPDLCCHPMQLKQVFMNLLVNAYQAIDERVQSQADGAALIEITTRERDAGIEVAIRDTGSGIAEADLQRIFDPFYTTKEVGAGTGLGLSTSYGIVKQHGGEMTVTSQLNQGTCFKVWLPFEQGLVSDEPRGQASGDQS